MRFLTAVQLCLFLAVPGMTQVNVGSKAFTESVTLGEIISILVREAGSEASHRKQMGGTQILWKALISGSIDVYPEYTGTITSEILADLNLQTHTEIRSALSLRGIAMSEPLGFNNTYAIGMTEARAHELGIETISDLREHPGLRLAFSNEFMERTDGWRSVAERYGISHTAKGIEHSLAYEALASGAIDATDLYSTDSEIVFHKLRVLRDDLSVFPKYDAVLLYRDSIPLEVKRSILRLQGAISEEKMIAMNAAVMVDKRSESSVASDFVRNVLNSSGAAVEESRARRILRYTAEHLSLVARSLLLAIIIAVPLGIFAWSRRATGQIVLGVVGILQTIPSLALLVMMIPLLGLGPAPAIAALFLYSLLPIVQNTYVGLHDISPQIRESADALGLSYFSKLRIVYLPLAARPILAGIRTAAVINVGTATLGALIAAGGLGEPILAGIRRADTAILLEGAIPAALLAIGVQVLFSLLERAILPRGLRLNRG